MIPCSYIDCGDRIKSCTLWAPACTVKLFKQSYLPAIENGKIGRFALFNLNDKVEQDDNCAHIYNKSLLYLVSHAFEKEPHIPLFRDGEALLGLEHCVQEDSRLRDLFASGKADLICTPNDQKNRVQNYSTARSHGDFDDDPATVRATLARMLGTEKVEGHFEFQRTRSSLRNKRKFIASQT